MFGSSASGSHRLEPRPRLVYVAGYGRSGTTLLDAYLGRLTAFESAGELAFVPEALEMDEICSCGESAGACYRWGNVEAPIARTASGRNVTRATTLVGYLFCRIRPNGDLAESWKRSTSAVVDAVATPSAEDKWIIDSSKTARSAAMRPDLLHHVLKAEIFVIFMQRDLRGVMNSTAKGTNRSLASLASAAPSPKRRRYAARTLAMWILANAHGYRLCRTLGPRRSVHLRYEQFIQDPNGTLDHIVRQLNVRSDLRDDGHELHLLTGNRVRHTPDRLRVINSEGVGGSGHSSGLNTTCDWIARSLGLVLYALLPSAWPQKSRDLSQ